MIFKCCIVHTSCTNNFQKINHVTFIQSLSQEINLVSDINGIIKPKTDTNFDKLLNVQ